MTELLIRAAAVGVLISVCAALLGIPLVLKKYAMIGDGLSHVAFGAMSVAMALSAAPLAVAIPVVIVAAVLLLRFGAGERTSGDSSLALVASTSLAIGITAVRLSGGTNIDINSFLFGSIWTVTKADVVLCVCLSIAVLGCFVYFYRVLFAVTFDESFAKTSGLPVSASNMAIALFTALVIVVGMRLMGTLLISSLIVFPAVSAMRVFGSFRGVAVCAAVLSVSGFALGLAGSYFFDTPTGAGVVIAHAVFFCIFALIGKKLRPHS